MQKRLQQAEEKPQSVGNEIITQLRARKLPQMVDWLDPVMLAQIGMRTIVSGTLGQYADQRLMQAATDRVSEEDLTRRYDYTKECAKPTPQCPLWVDYISDLGDGFEATYAMAYLMAADSLQVKGAKSSDAPVILDAGEILIMGGDQAYPQSSALEYQHRLIDPYNWAFAPASPEAAGKAERKLFALPGNHDWYDGLGAFDSLFCSARDRISEGEGKLIGGWRCKQHRSYFAIRLPYDWWIWGADIQLGGVFDDPQRDYFDIMSKETGNASKIILCLAEPSWTHENYDNLFEIVTIAQSKGAKVCAVLAGDLHHFSHYIATRALDAPHSGGDPPSPLLQTHFITCGGGGAFAHATHGLKSSVELKWPAEGAIDADFSRSTQKGVQAFRGSLLGEEASSALRNVEVKAKSYELQSKAIYPSRNTSRLLCLKNLCLPFRNWRFALFVGFVYFMFAWVFLSTDNALHPAFQSWWEAELEGVQSVQVAASNTYARLQNRVTRLENSPTSADEFELAQAKEAAASAKVAADGLGKIMDALYSRNGVSISKYRDGSRLPDPLTFARSDTVTDFKEYREYSFAQALKTILNPIRTLNAAWANPAFFFMLLGLWAGLIHYAQFHWREWYGLGAIAKFAVGTAHCVAHVVALLVVCAAALSLAFDAFVQPILVQNSLRNDWPALAQETIVKVWSAILQPYPEISLLLIYTLVFVALGGLLGAFIFGIYWSLMSTLFAKHSDDAFGALGLRHYKHFLRMKFEKDRLTIYPIAIDRVPGRRGWRAAGTEHAAPPFNGPKIAPKKELGPHLIEDPIVISVVAV